MFTYECFAMFTRKRKLSFYCSSWPTRIEYTLSVLIELLCTTLLHEPCAIVFGCLFCALEETFKRFEAISYLKLFTEVLGNIWHYPKCSSRSSFQLYEQ